MKISLETLQILDAIDRRGSFASAAEALDRVPSAITYSIRKLEEDLDLLIFDRRGHRAKLTDAGRELLDQGRHLLYAAHELEARVKRTATGWESEFRIVVDGIIPFDDLLPLIQRFDQQACGTRLRILQQTLSGVWESMIAGRADLAIGAAYDGPEIIRTRGEFQTNVLGVVDWIFAVAPSHPLANFPYPLKYTEIQTHRAIAVADTGLMLPSMSAGLFSGQDVLTVPTMSAKLEAQLAGLGCGHLPRRFAQPYLDSGQLIEKTIENPRLVGHSHLVWRGGNRGRALRWFLSQLTEETAMQRIFKGLFKPPHAET